MKSGPPDPAEIDSYIAVHPNNTATIFTGYVELGQGGPTALRQIAAEELDLEFGQVVDGQRRHVCVHQRLHSGQPDRGDRRHGDACRGGRGAARAAGPGVGAAEGAGPGSDGGQGRRVGAGRDPQRSVTYGELLGDKPFNRKFEPVRLQRAAIELPRKNPDNAPPKSRTAYTDRRHAGSAVRHARQGQRQISVHAACPRPGHAPRPRRVAARSSAPAA